MSDLTVMIISASLSHIPKKSFETQLIEERNEWIVLSRDLPFRDPINHLIISVYIIPLSHIQLSIQKCVRLPLRTHLTDFGSHLIFLADFVAGLQDVSQDGPSTRF